MPITIQEPPNRRRKTEGDNKESVGREEEGEGSISESTASPWEKFPARRKEDEGADVESTASIFNDVRAGDFKVKQVCPSLSPPLPAKDAVPN